MGGQILMKKPRFSLILASHPIITAIPLVRRDFLGSINQLKCGWTRGQAHGRR